MIPLFDTLAHPSTNRTFINKPSCNSFHELSETLQQNHFLGACAVALDQQDSYSPEDFIEACTSHPELIPIAAFNPLRKEALSQLELLKSLGYSGIKIHPRFSKIAYAEPVKEWAECFQKAYDLDLVVFLCTYYHGEISLYPNEDPLWKLVSLLKQVPPVKLILVHGGCRELMRYVDLARFNPNILIDLSFTLQKYAGSSLDLDIQYLFKNFDQRICIGSDFPDYSLSFTRSRFESLSQSISLEKQKNIAYQNILSFLGVEALFESKLKSLCKVND